VGERLPHPPDDLTPRERRPRRWAGRATVVYLVAVAAAAVLFRATADDAWPATVLLFGPRWVLAVPLVALVPLAAAARSWRAGVAAAVAAAVVAGPLLGGTVSPAGLVGPPVDAARLRVVTWNAAGTPPDRPAVREFLAAVRPDVVVVQESPAGGDGWPAGWHAVAGPAGVRVASVYPLRETGRLTDATLGAAGGGLRVEVETPAGPLAVVGIHLPTVRPGLEAALATRFRDVNELRAVIRVRDRASAVAREWAADAAVVAGDFNMPDESVVFRRDWGGFADAFAAAGTGFGWTKRTRWFGVRIDHVLAARPGPPAAAWVGPDLGSDHRPLVADLVLEADGP
jgi:endonuclease/exonuclease/phosphatase family metal-dependent hydrolase